MPAISMQEHPHCAAAGPSAAAPARSQVPDTLSGAVHGGTSAQAVPWWGWGELTGGWHCLSSWGGGEKFGGGSREQLDAPRSASLPAARFSGCLGTRSRSQSEQKAERGNNWKIKPRSFTAKTGTNQR